MHDVLLHSVVAALVADGDGASTISTTLVTVIGSVIVAMIGFLTAVLRREPRDATPVPPSTDETVRVLQTALQRAETRNVALERARERLEVRLDRLELFCYAHGLNPSDAYRQEHQ